MEKKHISAYKNAGLKTNRLTKRTSHERVSAYDSAQRSKKNRGGILGGTGYIAGNLGLGAAGVAEGIGDIVSAGADLLRGDTDMAKYRFIDNQTAEAQQRLAEAYNPGTIMKGAGDVASGVGNSLVFMIPYVGPYLAGAGYVGMGISSAAGYTGDVGMNEITYGAISGGSELLMDMFLGGAGKAAKNIGSSITRKIGKEAAEAGAKATAKLAGKSFGKSVLKETMKGALGEAAEEAAQEAIDPFLLRLFNIDENAEFSLGNVAYAGLIGGLSGGLMTAGPAAINYKSASRTGKAIRESGETEDFLQYTKQVLSGADRKIGKYKAAREATISAGEDAGAIGKAKTAVGNTISSIRTKRAEKRVADMAEKVRKNLDTYEGYLNKVDKTAKELEISDAVLGELRGNVFLLENASLLESYEEAILSEDADVKQALVDDFNERAKAGGGEKFDYTVDDLEANADDMLSAIASRYMMEDAYGQYMKKSGEVKRRNKATDAAEEAREGAEEAGAEEVDTGDASADTELFNGSTEDAWSVVTDETAGDYPVQSRDEVELIQAAINNDIPKASIQAMLESYRAGTSLSPQEFAEGWADGVILFGKYNVDEGGIDQESALGRMEESSRRAAIQYGREASMKERGEAIRKADEKRQADGERAGEAPVVRHPGIYLKQDLNDAQYAAYKAAEIMSKALNTDIEIRKSLSRNGKTVNGYFDKGSNTLVININAMRDGRHIALYTLGHEVTHYIREWSPEKFYEMGDFVIERLGTGAEKIIRDKLAFLEKTGQIEGKSASEAYEIAYEEVVANGMESVLADGTVLNELARENKTLWQKIKDRITEIIAKIKKAYGELKGTSRTAQILAETMDSLDELEQLFYEGVVEAGRGNRKTTEGTEPEVRYSLPEGEYDQPITKSDIQKLRDISEAHGGERVSINDFTREDIEASQKWAYKFYQEIGTKSPFFRAWFGDWRENDVSNIEFVNVPTIDISQAQLQHGNYAIDDTGWNIYAGKTLNDDTRHHSGGKRVNIKSLNAIDLILKNAILFDTIVSYPDKNKKSKNTAFMHKLYTPILFEGRPYIAKIAVEEYYNDTGNDISRKAYNLMAIKIEPAGGQLGIASSSSRPVTDSTISISDLYGLVKRFDKDFSSGRSVNPMMLEEYTDENGVKRTRPKVFYHGTRANFTTFELQDKPKYGRALGDGFYFTSSYVKAFQFANGRFSKGQDRGGVIMPVYLRMQNPYVIEANADRTKWINEYHKGDYDGIIDLKNDTYYVEGQTQIKSATDNIGTFDRGNSDIRYSIDDGEGNEIPDVSEKETDVERLEKENRDLSEKVRRMQYGMFRRAVESGEADARRHGRELSKAADTVLASIGVSDGKNRGRLLQKMKELYARLAAKDAISYEKAFTEAGEIAEWLISKQAVERDSTEANEIMKNLHGTKIRLTTTQKEEITQRWGSLDAFRKDMFGKVTISDKDGVPLDVQWAEWADQYPEIFSGDVAEADMPDRLEKLYRDIMEERDRVEPVEEYIDREVLTATIFSEVGQIGWKADAALVNEYTLLADSFEDAITSEQEYRIVKKYKEKSSDMEKSDKRLKELRKEVYELNHEIEALTNRIRGVEKSKREVWVLTALDEATERKSELLKEMNRISDSMRRDIDQLLSLRAAEPIRRAFQEEKKRADAMEKKAEKEAQRARNAEELAKDTVKKAYEKADERGRKYKEKVDRMAEESRERGEITTRKRTVMRVLGTLTTKLYHPTRTNHVSKELHDLAMKTLASVDPKAFGENRNHIKELGELSKKIERLERKAARTAKEQENLDKWKDRYEKLEEETVSLRKQAEAMLAAFIEYNENAPEETRYPQGILDIMQEKVGEIEDVPLARMGIRSLEAVETFVTMLDHQVANANKLFTLERDQTMSETGDKAKREVEEKTPLKFLSPNAMEFKGLDQIRKFFWKNMKPMTVFEAIGSDTLAELFQNVIDGEGTWAQDIMEARKKILETRDKFGYDKWKLDERREVETKSGKVNLSLSEMMSLYAYSFREQAYSHLEGGGFVLDPNATDTVTGKTLTFAQIEKRLNNSQRYTMDAEAMGKLASMLTEEQKAYVKEMQAYLTGLGEKGNTVSRKLYGIDIFTEEHYFPIKVKSEYLKSQTGPSGDPNIKNMGSAKDVKPEADNPLVLQDFDRVMVDHINSMASYHAFVLPLEDLTRVLNYKPSNAQIDEDGNWSVDETKKDYSTLKAVIESKYGDQANAYIIQLIRNLNGGVRSDSAAGIIDRGITAFKRASTMMSASVIIQQPTSIARAFAYIDPKYFANLAGIDFKNHKERYEMVKKYAPVAIIKEMGGYDTGVGARTGDYLNAAEYKTFGEKFSAFIKPKMFGGDPNYRAEVFGMGASYADEMAWIQIFEALVNEQADILKKPKESEEVRKAAGKRFEYVVRRTQVYDSTLTRSEYMRSKDTGVKMVTAFMAEPTTVVSMAADAIIRAERGDKMFLRRTAGAIAGSVLLNALLVSLVYAMRNDDEEETYGEKYLSSLATELVDGVNPAGYFPVLRDVVSIMQGYEVERSDMTLIQNLFDQVENITSSKRTVADKMFGVSGAVAAFFGVPMNNVYRDAKGLMNTVIGQVDTETTTGKGVSKALKEEFTTIFGLFDEQTTNQYQLYQAAVSGDTKHYNRVAARYESEKDVEMALRTALRENDKRIAEAAEARISGDLEAYKSLIEQIEGEGHFDRDIIIRAINNEMNAIKREEEKGKTVPRDEQAAEEEEASESIYKSTDLNEALERGDKEDYLDVYATLLAYKKEQGKTEAQAKASIKSSITVYWKKKYLLAWEENNQTEIKRIQSILLSTGLYGTRNDVAEMGQNWVKDYAESKNKK